MKVGLAFNPARVSFDGEGDDKRVILEVAVVLDDHKGSPIGELTTSVELDALGQGAGAGQESVDRVRRPRAF